MISVLQALNYAQLGQDEDALVEVRRVNERLQKMIADEKKPYEQLAIARYLGGVLYEDQRRPGLRVHRLRGGAGAGARAGPAGRAAAAAGEEDRARRGLREAAAALPGRRARAAGARPRARWWWWWRRAARRRSSPRSATSMAPQGELIAVPVFGTAGSRRARRSRWWTAATQPGVAAQDAVTVTSISRRGAAAPGGPGGALAAQAGGGRGGEGGALGAAGAATKSKEVAALTFLVLNATNAPDLRSWLSLPAEFQLARFRLPAGQTLVVVDAGGQAQYPGGGREAAPGARRRRPALRLSVSLLPPGEGLGGDLSPRPPCPPPSGCPSPGAYPGPPGSG